MAPAGSYNAWLGWANGMCGWEVGSRGRGKPGSVSSRPHPSVLGSVSGSSCDCSVASVLLLQGCKDFLLLLFPGAASLSPIGFSGFSSFG